LWIIRLDTPSLAAYTGGVPGLQPTSPQITGASQLDVAAPASISYADFLESQQANALARMNRALGRPVDVEFRYMNVLDGMAVWADAAEAARLARLPGVAGVYRDEVRELTTDVSHELIGSAAVWGGDTAEGVATRGEGVVVGMLDTGVNPDHPSFAATDADGYTHVNPLGAGNYLGVCAPDHPQHEDICNDKLIGAWNFHPDSPSAQDVNDHGSHTGSTMAGNVHEAVFTIGDTTFTRTVQGVAPRANVISYLVCFPSCPESSMLAAVNQAIADGVDVLNFSISGGDDPWNDPVDQAFLEAFNAGIFIAASAGNDGPAPGTVARTGPWNASVAASTHSRVFAQTLAVTGPGAVPASLTSVAAVPGEGRALNDTIDAQVHDAETVDPGNGLGCEPFPFGVFDGGIALIDRGTCTFANKVNNATFGGASAVVVVNNVAGPPVGMGGLESTTRPSVQIDQADGAQLRDFIAGAAEPVELRLDPAAEVAVNEEWVDIMAGFSSRGPSRLDVLAPTFTAPGVNILAAAAADNGDPLQYAVLQGTSMAAPHGAGAAALLKALHPEWSPAKIRSALAATADPNALLKDDGHTSADPFDQGSGRLNVAAAAQVGLVMEETYDNFLAANPATGGDPKRLNVPSMVDNECAETCTWTRMLTSVADAAATYEALIDAPAGMEITVEPQTFTIAAGATQQVEITADVSALPTEQWSFASVGFQTDSVHPGTNIPITPVHYPVAVVPIATPPAMTLDPDQVTVRQSSGQVTEHALTIGNTGGIDLEWSLVHDEPVRLPMSRVTPIDTVPPRPTASGDVRLRRDPAAGDRVVVRPQALPVGSRTAILTHSRSQAIADNNSTACAGGRGSADTGYLRTFTLQDFGITAAFEVTEVSFAIQRLLGPPQTIGVNLYTLQDDNRLTYENLTEIGTAQVTLSAQEMTTITVPVTGTVPAGSTLVVEIDTPDRLESGGFLYIGSNSAGQTAPSYIRADACDLPEPADLAGLGFPDMHVIMNVTGVTEGPTCDAVSWASLTPNHGVVPPDGTQATTVTIDTTGMSPGTYEANLCLKTNQPMRPLHTVVPLTLTVGDDEPAPEASQTIVATVPAPPGDGSLVISVDSDDRTVTLPPLQLAGTADRLSATGELRPVTVTDTRTATDPGWDATAQVTDFASSEFTFSGGYLGWTPEVVSHSEGQQVSAGEAVAPDFPDGEAGLSTPRELAHGQAGAGAGTAVLGAQLALTVPVDTPAGTYVATLTLTAI
jgi:subtilisin family serine protease